MTPLRALAALSAALLALRLYAASAVGFGDAEALYVAYGLHPQPLYLDHPGLVGWVARRLGAPPSPAALHAVTALAATATPWAGVAAARLLGAAPARAPLAGLALLAAPEISVGLFALTPDLLLCPLWLLSLGLWGAGLRGGRAWLFAAAGLCAGLGAWAKVPALLLLPPMALSALRARRPGPWLGVAAALPLAALLLAAEASWGGAMLRHRLISTQGQAGLSLRNAAALVGGQIGYLSPLVAWSAALLLRSLWGRRGSLDEPQRWLLWATLLGAAPLAALCLWSRVAEPHWMAPAWLPLSLLLPLSPAVLSPRLSRWALASGASLALLVHAWTLSDLAPRWLGGAYEARYDLANDLFLWREAGPHLSQLRSEAGGAVVALAPHWIIAAQIEANGGPPAGTLASSPASALPADDFGRWTPFALWSKAPRVLWVSDDRFSLETPAELSGRPLLLERRVELRRGGRAVRAARLALFGPPAP